VPLYWCDAPAQLSGDRVRSVLACGKTADGPACGGVQHPLLVAAGAGQQVLHPVRAGVPGSLGKRPAVAVLELGQ